MLKDLSSVIALVGSIVLAAPAVAEVSIKVDKTTQRMTVPIDGQQRYSWPILTGTADYSTPVGCVSACNVDPLRRGIGVQI